MKRFFYRMGLFSAGLLGPCALLAAETVKSGPLTSEPIGSGSYVQMVLGLLFIIALIFGMGWFIRRLGTFNSVASGNLKLLGGLSLGQREKIVLVQVGEIQLLVGVAPGQVRTLHVLDKPVSDASPQPMSSGFAEKLNQLLKQQKSR
ncbi:flagellar biosynthetic protein FliO [Thiohalophilus sp.]|uniref:flagellar biosynthetic protein FliO n=1 Tax=Thiohalophilus sp. TaxID=3028392 RepID=UPI002ACD69F0|nr:flagellar biosynthetic protein FliO [Thiohalophilus sp.]MDZ7804171.1 flagellar biosynthetic protein FliO [Thiohalophilus sp.]